jgi:two-component system, NarL family, sensor histidine kinase DevS
VVSSRDRQPDPAADVPVELTFPDLPRMELEESLAELTSRAATVLSAQGRLRALLRANALVGSELSLPVVLRHIVKAARELVGARYAALGVVAEDGTLEQFVHVGMEPDTVARIGHLPRGHGILGYLIRHPEPVRLEDLSAHPASIGFPAEHPPMGTFLGVPIRIRNDVFGNLYLTESTRGSFTAEDEQLLSALARTAAVAIQNARLYEDSERRRRWQAVSTQVTQQLFGGDDERPAAVVAGFALQGAEGDFALMERSDGGHVAVGTAAQDLADQLGGRWPGVLDRVIEPVRRTREPLLVVPASEANGAGDDLAKHITSILAVPITPQRATDGRMQAEMHAGVTDVLVVGRVAGRPAFGHSDLEQLATFAGHAQVALELDRSRADQQTMALLAEHDRIAADLHDHVIQELFATGMGLQGMLSGIERPDLRGRLLASVDALDNTIRHIRATIFQLQHDQTRSASLELRLLEVVEEERAALGSAINVTLSGPLDDQVPAQLVEGAVAVVREALSNAARHAQAREVRLTVAMSDASLEITVEDDGVGPDHPTRSSGLTNLRNRAERHHGTFDISSSAHGGTRLRWTVPNGR